MIEAGLCWCECVCCACVITRADCSSCLRLCYCSYTLYEKKMTQSLITLSVSTFWVYARAHMRLFVFFLPYLCCFNIISHKQFLPHFVPSEYRFFVDFYNEIDNLRKSQVCACVFIEMNSEYVYPKWTIHLSASTFTGTRTRTHRHHTMSFINYIPAHMHTRRL